MIYLACIVATLIGGIALHRRGVAPWRLYALGTEMFLLIGVATVVVTRWAPHLILSFPFGSGGAMRQWSSGGGPTYEVFFAPLIGVLLALILPTMVCALMWWQQRIGAMFHPSLTRWLFWPIAAGLMLIPGVVTLVLVNGGTQIADPQPILKLSALANSTGLAAFVALAALTVWSLVRWVGSRL